MLITINCRLFAQSCHCIDMIDSFNRHQLKKIDYQEFTLCSFADSIDNMVKYKKIPLFLYNPCFDDYPLNGDHDTTSIRLCILNRVCNKDVLKYLICLDDIRMKKTCSISNNSDVNEGYISANSLRAAVPYIDKSFYELIVWRYYQLLFGKEGEQMK